MKQFKPTKPIASESDTWHNWFNSAYSQVSLDSTISGDINRQFGTCPISSKVFTSSPPLMQIKQIHECRY